MKQLVYICFVFLAISCKAQLSPQSKKITERFFPDPAIEINTPAFQKKKGYTSYEELISFLEVKVNAYPNLLQLSYIGESQKGKKVPFLVLKKNNEQEKVKVWIQGGLHGNEPGSVEAVLYLIEQLLSNPTYAHLLNRLHIGFVPLANIDGYEKLDRYAANGLDLNRDQTKLNVQESIFLKQTFSDFNAEVALDFHEYRPYRRDFVQMSTYGISSIYDAMFLFSGNLNVPENLRTYTEDRFVQAARDSLDSHQLTHHPYMSTTKVLGEVHFNQGSENSRSSATSYSLANTISTLVEVRGVGIGKTSYKRRVYSAFLIGIAYLQTAYQYSDELKQQLKLARESEHHAALKTAKKISQQQIKVIDLDSKEAIDMEVTIRDANELRPMKIRDRPFAYLILPNETEVIKRLSVLGLEIEYLKNSKVLKVEEYVVKSYEKDAEKYEGVHRQTVTTELEQVSKEFSAGTAIVYLNQKAGNMAMEVLEPEVQNSFVSFEVIPTDLGEKLPIYRYLPKEQIELN